jgi:predicted AlkP superfamily phosphohydrolase/phosphomutase
MTNKTLIIGLDGVTFDLIKPWVEQGKLPTFKLLLEQGAHGILKSSIPPASCTAWPSFYTGTNPGKFGVYNFENFKPNSYDTYFVNYHSIKEKTLWDIFGENEKKSAIMNVPVTYPVREMKGIMISGTAISPEYAVFPKEFKSELPSDYLFNIPPVHSSGRDKYIETNFKSMEQQYNLINKFLEQDYDLIFSVFRTTDFFCHRFLKSMVDQDEKYKNTLYDAYKKVDDYLAELIKVKNTNLIIMSDHGNTFLKKTFFINDWLIQQGYLTIKKYHKSLLKKIGINQDNVYHFLTKLKLAWITKLLSKKIKEKVPKKLAQSIDLNNVDWSKTKAIAKFPSGININSKSKRPQGIVSDEEYDNLITELKTKLKNVQDNGEKLNIEVFDNTVYSGNYKNLAPDLVLLIEGGSYRTASSIGNEEILMGNVSPNSTSNHTMDGIFIAFGPDIKQIKIDDADITDVAPTILHLNNITPPENMDGKVLTQIFNKEFESTEKTEQSTSQLNSTEKEPEEEYYNQEEEDIVKERLKSLGYLD